MNKRKRITTPPRKMKSVFLIFCEGQTEEVYIDMLKQQYHSPIRIVSSVQGQNISKRIISSFQKNMQISNSDIVTTFLMYDIDVEELLPRLKACDAELLLSNPSIELWFLLHNKEQHAAISTENVITLLQKSAPEWKNYRKAHLTDEQIRQLWNNRLEAVKRAKALKEISNPSTGIYLLIEKLEESKQSSEPKS